MDNNYDVLHVPNSTGYGINLYYDYIRKVQNLYKAVDSRTADHSLVLILSNNPEYLNQYLNVLPTPSEFYNNNYPFDRFTLDFQYISSSMSQSKGGDLKDNVVVKSNGKVTFTFPYQDPVAKG